MPIEQEDPCARAQQLRQIRDDLISGQATAEYESESGNGTKRRVKYTQANLQMLVKEINRAEAECAAVQGNAKPRRYAMRGVIRR